MTTEAGMDPRMSETATKQVKVCKVQKMEMFGLLDLTAHMHRGLKAPITPEKLTSIILSVLVIGFILASIKS